MSAEALLAQMLEQFNFSYNGNKAPFGLYLHTPWCGRLVRPRGRQRGAYFMLSPITHGRNLPAPSSCRACWHQLALARRNAGSMPLRHTALCLTLL